MKTLGFIHKKTTVFHHSPETESFSEVTENLVQLVPLPGGEMNTHQKRAEG